jgi:hypothetical protein
MKVFGPRSENAALKKGESPGIRLKVSEKGAVSVYVMGELPVTLFKDVQSRVVEAVGCVRRHSRFYCCERSAVESKRVRMGCRAGVKDRALFISFSRAES